MVQVMINGKKYIMHTNLAITICKSQRNESLGINTPDFLALKRSFFCHYAENHKSQGIAWWEMMNVIGEYA